MSDLTREQIAEHRAFLAGITAEARRNVMQHVGPLAGIAASQELDAVVRAAQEEILFLHRVGLLTDDD